MPITNPFAYGNPITDPFRFCGRDYELLRIHDAIRQMRSLSIIGEQRVGKSSLLKYVASPDTIRQAGLGDEFVFCFVDLQGFEEIDQEDFWKWVLAELANKLPEDLAIGVNSIFNLHTLALRSVFEDLTSKNIVFLFDEFETLLANPKFSPAFYGLLRWLSQNCSVAFITATQRELVYHCLNDATKTSPFFNIFDNLVLRPFQPSECQDLIARYLRATNVQFTNTEITKLIQLSGGYPEFFQMACAFLYYGYNAGHETARWAAVEDQFRMQLKSHAEYFWNKSEEEERILLALLALLSKEDNAGVAEKKLSSLYPRYKSDLLTLYCRSLVLRENGNFRLFSPIFTDWILMELTDLSKPAEISLEEWLAEYQKNFGAKVLQRLGKFEDEFHNINPKYWDLLGKTLLMVRDPQPIIEIIRKIGEALGGLM